MRLRSFLDALLRRSSLEARMDSEMRFHLESLRDDLIRQGLAPKEAKKRARQEFGVMEARKDECREARGLRWTEEIAQDLRYAVRSLRKKPGFMAVAVATLALGIGANTAIFSVLQAVILRPLPYPQPDRLVVIRERDAKNRSFSVTWPDFEDWRNQSRSFSALAAYTGASEELTGILHPQLLSGAKVSSSYFSLFGVRPEIGRLLSTSDDHPGSDPVVVLSSALWQNTYGGDPHILGRTVVLSGSPYTVIGIASPPPISSKHSADFYLPIGPSAADPGFNNRATHQSLRVLGRVAPNKTLAGARADLDTIMSRLEKQYPATNTGHRALVTPLAEDLFGDLKSVLYALSGAVGLVLLIACVNVANLLLARATDRRKEFAVRASMGAGRARLARQMITESTLLALLGGVCGVTLAAAAMKPLLRFAPSGIPRLDSVHLDAAPLLFTLAVTFLTGLLFGAAPAFHASRPDVNEALKDGGRSSSGGRGRERTRAGLLITEVSLTSLLLVVSMLLIRSLATALATDPGFQPDHLAALNIVLLNRKYEEPIAGQNFLSEATEQIRHVPGVRSVGMATCPPLAADCGDYWYEIPGRTHFTPGSADDSLFNTADPGYFPSIGAPILQGRNFRASDKAGTPLVAIINETLARKWWPKDSPVGWKIKDGGPGDNGDLYEIVGVAKDVNREGLDTPPMPEFFRAAAQKHNTSITFLVRSAFDPLQVASQIEAAIHRVDKDLPVRIAPVTQTMAESLARRRFLTALLASFGALALMLAGVGVFGVIAYQVAQRTHEIGIRKALGADTREVLALFTGRAVLLTMSGAVLGIAASLGASRLVSGLLFGVKPWDPVTLALTLVILCLLAAAASYIPARRAAAVDPLAALRRD